MVQKEARAQHALEVDGTALPAAAPAQLASRNSWLVATRSWARLRIRSGSLSSTIDAAGRMSSSPSGRGPLSYKEAQ